MQTHAARFRRRFFRFGEAPARSQRCAAFTRVELFAVAAALALLAVIALPMLGGTRVESDRLGCVSNLRRIGQAYQLWANDHDGYLPIMLDYRLGGLRSYPGGMLNNGWFHYAWISNELVTPRLLACPGDESTKVARDFSGSAQGGFVNPAFRGNALSYFTSLDITPGQMLNPVSGDRNMQPNGGLGGDSSGVTVSLSITLTPPTTSWLPYLHGGTGNLLLMDGRVLQTSSDSLRRYLGTTLVTNGQTGTLHLLMPRW